MEVVDVQHVYLDSTKVNLEIRTVHDVHETLTPITKMEALHAVSFN